MALVEQEVEATVTVDMMIEGDGRVSDVRVLEASHPGVWDQEIVDALMEWEYRAPVVDGVRIRRRTEPLTIRTFFYPCPESATSSTEVMDLCLRWTEAP